MSLLLEQKFHPYWILWMFCKLNMSIAFDMQNLNQNPRTLLPKFYGLYCYKVRKWFMTCNSGCLNAELSFRLIIPNRRSFVIVCICQCSGKNIRFVVMNNLLPSSIRMHSKYDLKGSTFKRKASKHETVKPNPTFKDLDFVDQHPDGILMEVDTYNALIKTMERDCRVGTDNDDCRSHTSLFVRLEEFWQIIT